MQIVPETQGGSPGGAGTQEAGVGAAPETLEAEAWVTKLCWASRGRRARAGAASRQPGASARGERAPAGPAVRAGGSPRGC